MAIIGPFTNVPEPGAPIASAWAQQLTQYAVDLVQSGTYTPTLGIIAVGTGGSATNTANWTFIGAPNAGGKGLLILSGVITFGTSGAVLPQAGSETIGLPPGFSLVGLTNVAVVGHCTYQIGGSNFAGALWSSGATAMRPVSALTNGTVDNWGDINATIPGAWVAGSTIVWFATCPVTRS